MPILPITATVFRNQIQQFAASGITAPVWTLDGIGTLNQSGQYGAPNLDGNALVRVHTAAWASVNAAYFTQNADDTLTKNTNNTAYYDPVVSSAKLNSIGDAVEYTCPFTGGWGIYVRSINYSHYFGIYGGTLKEITPSGTYTPTFAQNQAGDVIRLEIVTGNKFQYSRNGVVEYTSVNAYTGGNFVFTIDAAMGLGTVIKLPKWFGAGVTNYTEAQATVTVTIAIDNFFLKDPLVQYPPKSNLEAWHTANKSDLNGSILSLVDLSGKHRHIAASANLPTVQNNIINGLPCVYFNDTKNPLTYSGNLTARHIFVVCAFDGGATFDTYRGIISAPTTHSILLGQTTADKFFDLQYSQLGGYEYRKADTIFAETNQKAGMNGLFKVYEIKIDFGVGLNGIQIGQDKNLTSRKWKGWFAESLVYSAVKNDLERMRIYQYFAMKYRLWQENSTGLYLFPFPANKPRTSIRNKEVYVSEPYTGDPKALVRGNFASGFELPFLLRPQAEYEAAEAFYAQHYPLTHYVFRDYRFYPPKDSVCKITSPFREAGSDVTFRFNYSFDTIQV